MPINSNTFLNLKSVDVREILKTSRKIRVPQNLFEGVKISPFEPRNMLVFPRMSKRSLIARGFRSHHERYVLLTSIKGMGRIGVDTRMHQLSAGESILIFPFQTHWFAEVTTEPVHWVVVTFEHPKDRRLEAFRNFGSMANTNANFGFLRGLAESWAHGANREAAPLYLSLWLHALLLKANPASMLSSALNAKRRGAHEWIAQVNQYIFDRRHLPISLKELAEGMAISESLLRKKFRTAVGISIGKHVREVKLRYACELLHDTQLRIGEIATRCGYESLFSFSRAFHHVYDLSPSDYRMKFD